MKIKNLLSRKVKEKKDLPLLTAKEAFESTKEPQLRKVIEKINACRKEGKLSAFICDEELHQETIDALLEKGYDLSMSYSNIEEFEHYFNEALWDKRASGKIRKDKR